MNNNNKRVNVSFDLQEADHLTLKIMCLHKKISLRAFCSQLVEKAIADMEDAEDYADGVKAVEDCRARRIEVCSHESVLKELNINV